jgi:hypothetical protein
LTPGEKAAIWKLPSEHPEATPILSQIGCGATAFDGPISSDPDRLPRF